MNAMRDGKVAGYRQTPEFGAWRKTFGRHHAIQQTLRMQLQQKMSEMQQLQMALEKVTVGKQRLLQLMPDEKTYELEGQRAPAQAQGGMGDEMAGGMGGGMGGEEIAL